MSRLQDCFLAFGAAVAVVAAAYLAANGLGASTWGWFLVIAVILGVSAA